MAIDRPTIVDDSGSGTDGTIADAAWVDDLCDRIDAAIDGASASVRSVALGGTGVATLASDGVVIGNGTSPVTVASSVTDKPLVGNSGADPSFKTLPVAGGGTGVATLAAHGVVVGNDAGAVAVTGAGTAGQVLTSNGASADPTFQAASGTVDPGVCRGRLTLTSGTPITVADVTAATNVYFTPYQGKHVALYDGASAWVLRAFTETTLALGTITASLPYDVFAYDNSGTLALEKLAWTNTTTRATALTLQDGVLVKTGATTRRYLGTFYTTSTTTTEDSYAIRGLFNMAWRMDRPLRAVDTTDSWSYSTATWRQARATSTNQIAIMVGVSEEGIGVDAFHLAANDGASAAAATGIGLDSTSAPVASSRMTRSRPPAAGVSGGMMARFETIPAVGYHYFAWLERDDTGAGTTTFYGDAGVTTVQSGIGGNWRC